MRQSQEMKYDWATNTSSQSADDSSALLRVQMFLSIILSTSTTSSPVYKTISTKAPFNPVKF